MLKFLIVDPTTEYWNSLPPIPEIVQSVISSVWFKISLAVIGFSAFILLNILIHRRILERKLNQEWRAEQLEKEESKVNGILNKDLNKLNSEKLDEFLDEMRDIDVSYQTIKKFSSKIDKKSEEAEKLYNKKLESEELERRNQERIRLTEEIEELKKQKYAEELKQKCRDDIILKKLNPSENWIFEFDKLDPKEVEVLQNAEFSKVTEFDPINKKNTTFLVTRILNHSPTHTFLVERIKQMVIKYAKIKRVSLHETREADITFEIGKTKYAFEIETGSLLSKKDQRKEKVNYLNRKYGKNWWFIVSHRDLGKKYREFGRVTTRTGVSKIIEKIAQK
ncbi:MAG: hypothetical protein KKF50_03310 [Nanoarchaeota archaeon]|nr:hypothetical protein [Nanoarchaeota archaeon]